MELDKEYKRKLIELIKELNKTISQKTSTEQKISELKAITKKYNPEWGDSEILKFLDIYLLMCVLLYGMVNIQDL